MSTPNTLGGTNALNERPLQNLEQTIAALDGGPMTLNPDSGLQIVRTWIDTLRSTERPVLLQVAALLEELEEQLAMDELDGPTIGDLMVRLGESTRSAADEANDERLMPRLDRLATVLVSAGQALGGSTIETDTPGPAGASEA